MFSLIIFACVAGTNCPGFELSRQIPSAMACAASPQTQVTIERFLQHYPDWKLEGFRCVPADEVDEYLGRNKA